jgi:site-specific recombinase XerD
MCAMLNIQRRHTPKCPDRNHPNGPNFLGCRGHCPLRIFGMLNGKRVRRSLKTRDVRRATRVLGEMEDEGTLTRPRKALDDAIEAFMSQHAQQASETKRKYARVLKYLNEYSASKSVRYVDQMNAESLDGYALWRNKTNWTWIKEIEILRQFFSFCIDREWTSKNPAKSLKRPKMLEANDVTPYTQAEMVQIIAACDHIGRANYERLRARAMVLLMRYTGLRISDVVSLSKDHVKGRHLEKRAIKNRRMIRMELHPQVLKALELAPRPKAAAQDSKMYFSSNKASLRSLVKGAQRTLKAVFKRAKVEGAHPHRFRHTLASELLAKGVSIEEIANILGDSPATIRRHYAKWTPELQARHDQIMRSIHGTVLAQTEHEARTF